MATCKDCERWHQKFYCFCGDAFGNERNDVERVCKDFKKIEENIMNREILFRGKLPAYGDWVYGYLNQHRGKPIIDTSGMEIYSSDYFINDFMAKVDTDIYGEIYKVKPETVGQYTGLTDKNGKKIFEGDIIKAEQWYISGCYPHTEIKTFAVKIPDIYQIIVESAEVIGNVYDNSELLEVGK